MALRALVLCRPPFFFSFFYSRHRKIDRRPLDSNWCFHWVKGGCVLWSIDWLVFVTRADCRRWVRLLILPLWLKVWNHSLVSFFGQKSNLTCPPPTSHPPLNLTFWHKAFIRAAHRCIFLLHSRTKASWSRFLARWCETQRIWVLPRNAVAHIGFSQTSCPFVIALSLLSGFPWCKNRVPH